MSLRSRCRFVLGLVLALVCEAAVGGLARADEVAPGGKEVSASPPNAKPVAGGIDAVERAEASLREYVFDEALARIEQALSAGGLSRKLLSRALKVRAESLSALNRPEEAEHAFAQLLSVQPDFAIDDRLGPRIRSPFFEARAFLDKQPARPGLTVVIREDRPGRVDIRVHDPLAMVAKVVVHHRPRGGGGFAAVELPKRGGVLPLSEASTHELYVRALTSQRSIAFELGTPTAPMSTEVTTTVMSAPPAGHGARHGSGPPLRPMRPPTQPDRETSVFESPVFWIIAGVVVTGAAATGIVLAAQ